MMMIGSLENYVYWLAVVWTHKLCISCKGSWHIETRWAVCQKENKFNFAKGCKKCKANNLVLCKRVIVPSFLGLSCYFVACIFTNICWTVRTFTLQTLLIHASASNTWHWGPHYWQLSPRLWTNQQLFRCPAALLFFHICLIETRIPFPPTTFRTCRNPILGHKCDNYPRGPLQLVSKRSSPQTMVLWDGSEEGVAATCFDECNSPTRQWQ